MLVTVTAARWLGCLAAGLVILSACSVGPASIEEESTPLNTTVPLNDDAAMPEDDGSGFIVFEAAPTKVSIHWNDSIGEPYGQLERLRSVLENQGEVVRMVTNSGIYSPGQTPAGLHVEEGQELRPINLLGGEGNFQLLPNGVFYVAEGKAGVLESSRYVESGIQPQVAVQSGPQLLIDGEIHPEFSETSINKFVRNGVGILPNGNVVFLLSRQPVTFWDFASEFKRRGVENALYLDGKISAMSFPVDGKVLFPNIPFAGMLAVTD